MYFPFALWIERPQTALYHKKLLAGGFSFDAFGSMWHTEQALTRDELAGGLADAVGLVLDAHESHLEVADELRLTLCE